MGNRRERRCFSRFPILHSRFPQQAAILAARSQRADIAIHVGA
ncbi:hypothetical protein [Lysobacter gummosus]